MTRLALLMLALGACDSDPDPQASSSQENDPVPIVTPGLATLEGRTAQPGPAPQISPNGGFRIEDGPALHGDPIACMAFHACCDGVNGQVTPAGLACGLAPAAASGDCTRALESVREIFREQGFPLPPGC